MAAPYQRPDYLKALRGRYSVEREVGAHRLPSVGILS